MSQLILNKRDPGIAAAVKNCKLGEYKLFEQVGGKVTKTDDNELVLDVTELEYSDEEKAEPEETTEEMPEAETETEPVAMSSRGPQTAKLKY